jgi:transposase
VSTRSKRRPGRPSKYPPEFQRDAVAMVLDEHRSTAEVGRALGVNEGTLGNWVVRERNGRNAGACVEHR